jgi:hypothetical protein
MKRGKIIDWPSGYPNPDIVASKVIYKGHVKHKTYWSHLGKPGWIPTSDDAKCDHFEDGSWPELQAVLQAAVRSQYIGAFRGDYPSRAWAFINGVLHEARLDEQGHGTYHGFPIDHPFQYPTLKYCTNITHLEQAPHVEIPYIKD